MYHVLIILLHRPFVADGHLYSTSRSVSVDCFMKCASAASSIVLLLRAYHRAFSSRRAPYLISYATYVAATIHARIAAKRSHDSSAHNNLATCLAVLNENQETNTAVSKAMMIMQSLTKRLGVVIDNVSAQALEMDGFEKPGDANVPSRGAAEQQFASVPFDRPASSNTMGALAPGSIPQNGTTSPESDWMDIDGIIQSFLQEHDGNNGNGMRPMPQPDQHPSGQFARSPWFQHEQQQQQQPPQVPMGPDYTVGNQPVMPMQQPIPQVEPGLGGGYQWHEDPLFGLNGSSMDNFTFMPW